MDELQVTIDGQRALFSGWMTRYTLAELDTKSSARLTEIQACSSIDMQAVEHTDTAALAWLINYCSTRQRQDNPIELTNVPHAMLKLAALSDVEDLLPMAK